MRVLVPTIKIIDDVYHNIPGFPLWTIKIRHILNMSACKQWTYLTKVSGYWSLYRSKISDQQILSAMKGGLNFSSLPSSATLSSTFCWSFLDPASSVCSPYFSVLYLAPAPAKKLVYPFKFVLSATDRRH